MAGDKRTRNKRKKPFRKGGRGKPDPDESVITAESIVDGQPARVIAHHGVAVLVRFESGEEKQIWLQPDQRAVVGDRVQVAAGRLGVEPAYGILRRRDPRGRERTIATNLDYLGVVVAPEPREPPGYIDRGFVIARAAGIEPFLVLNKIDLDEDNVLGDRLQEIYGPSAPVLRVSAQSGENVDSVRALLAAGDVGSTRSESECDDAPDSMALGEDDQAVSTSEAEAVRPTIHEGKLGAFVGPSGVGKSSLLNRLVPDLALRVGELNRGSGKGRHTTTTATLHALEGGGTLVDTAGFKDFIAVDLDPLDAATHFPGFEGAAEAGCRFRDCLHRSEPDCAILAAVERGDVDPRRHRAYVQLIEELETSDGRS